MLEHVSLELTLPTGQLPSLQEIGTTGELGASGFVDVRVNATADNTFSGNELVKFYVEAGGQVDIFSNRKGTTGDAFVFVAISGYLVNVP